MKFGNNYAIEIESHIKKHLFLDNSGITIQYFCFFGNNYAMFGNNYAIPPVFSGITMQYPVFINFSF